LTNDPPVHVLLPAGVLLALPEACRTRRLPGAVDEAAVAAAGEVSLMFDATPGFAVGLAPAAAAASTVVHDREVVACVTPDASVMAVCSRLLRALPSAASAPADTPEIETDSTRFAEPPSLEGAADSSTTGTGVPLGVEVRDGVALREALFEAVALAEAELDAVSEADGVPVPVLVTLPLELPVGLALRESELLLLAVADCGEGDGRMDDRSGGTGIGFGGRWEH